MDFLLDQEMSLRRTDDAFHFPEREKIRNYLKKAKLSNFSNVKLQGVFVEERDASRRKQEWIQQASERTIFRCTMSNRYALENTREATSQN